MAVEHLVPLRGIPDEYHAEAIAKLTDGLTPGEQISENVEDFGHAVAREYDRYMYPLSKTKNSYEKQPLFNTKAHDAECSCGGIVDLDRLVASRLLVQANSGRRQVARSGSSSRRRTARAAPRHRPGGRVRDAPRAFDYVLAAKTGGDVASPKTAKLLCRRLVELGASAVLDLYELKLPERREFVKLFLDGADGAAARRSGGRSSS
jgi:hypothetical protein